MICRFTGSGLNVSRIQNSVHRTQNPVFFPSFLKNFFEKPTSYYVVSITILCTKVYTQHCTARAQQLLLHGENCSHYELTQLLFTQRSGLIKWEQSFHRYRTG